jgi:hypothetical protein
MTLFRKVRKDAPTSEGTHVFRGVMGVIIILALVIASLTYWLPPTTSASPQGPQQKTTPAPQKTKAASVSKSVVGTPR